MKNIAYQAENCNGDSTASTQNNAAFVESAFNESIPNRGGEEEKKQKVHSFSRKLAKEIQAKKRKLNPKAKHAWHETTLLKYLANRVQASKNVVDGKRWFYTTIEKLAEQFPYLGTTTAYDLIKSLEVMGYVELGNFNRYKYDRTLWFHVPKAVCNAAEEDLVYFDASVAEGVGVVAAVIQRNFEYWIGECKEKGLRPRVNMSPSILADLLPCGKSTIKRGLKALEGKYLHKLSTTEPTYGIPEIDRGSYPNGRGPNPNDKGSYPNESGSYPNNDTYWKTVINPLESSSKVKPAVLVLENCSDDKEANDEQMHLLYDTISPFADEQDRNEMRHDASAALGSVYAISSPSTTQVNQPEIIESISPFDELMALQNQMDAAAPASLAEVPSAENMDDAVGDVNSPWPTVHSLEELHRINEGTSDTAKEFLRKLGMEPKFALSVQHLGLDTMTSVPGDVLDELSLNADGDEIMDAMLPYFHGVLEQTPLDPFDPLSQSIYHGTLECLIGAFLWPKKHGGSYLHPIPSLIGVTYKLQIILWRRAENQRLAAVAEEFAERREEYASVDEHKEGEPFLSPAEKMRAFRNALNSMNKVGWIWFDQTLQTNRIKVTKAGLTRIQKLFELNPDLTPLDLLPIMDGCMKLYAGQPAPPKKFKWKTKWHARMAHRLDIFASYLKTIVRQLGITSPVKVYLNDEQPDEEVQEANMALAA